MNPTPRLLAFAALLAISPLSTHAQNWQPLTTGLPANASVTAIAGNSDGSDLFIGVATPLESTGIYRSTDNGTTWTKTANGPASNPNTSVSAAELLVHGTTVIATRFTNNGELFYSHDSGASWHHATGIPNNSAQPIGANGGVVDLARDGSTFYCQVLPQGPYKSTDGGQTWSPANTGITGLGSYIRVINGRVFASQGSSGLWSSDNQGSSWTLRSTTPTLSYATPPRLATFGNRIVLAAHDSPTSVLTAVAGERAWVGSDAGLPTGARHADIESSTTAIFSAGGTNTPGGQQIPYVAQSSNAGLSWSPLSASGLVGPETTWHYASELCVHNGYLYAATYSFGGTHRFVRLALTNGEYPQAPVFVTQPTPATLTSGAGQTATFQALASGSGTLTYQWRKNGDPLTGKTSPTLTLTNLQASAAGSYTVAVSNGSVTVISNPAVLTISPSDPGKLDYSFDAPISKVFSGTTLFGGTAYKVLPQADGKILIAGDFDRVAVTPGNPFPTGGTPCTNIARFTSSGVLDPTFTLGTVATGGVIKALAVQSDGKILIGGTFTSYAGTARNRLARLNADGTLDTDFMASGAGFNGEVLEILVQTDGKILVGGDFGTVHGQSRANLVRLLANGDRDPTFLPSLTGPNSIVRALALSGESLYIGGDFGNFNGSNSGRITKTDLTGVRDANFNTAGSGISSGAVFDIAIQTDGKPIITGSFTTYNGNSNVANRIIRLTANGAIDNVFGTGLGQAGFSLAIQPDDKIIVSGNFTTAGGSSRNRLARFLANGTLDPDFNPGAGISSTADLALQNDGKLLVAGAFTTYDNVTRFLVARVFTGLSNPDVITLEPEIVVEEPVGTNLVDDSASLVFGDSNIVTPVIKTVTIRNTGATDLTGITLSHSGANVSDFTVGALGSTTLAPGANTTFTVTFTPTAAGARGAALHIASNDADENPFDVTLSGTGVAADPYALTFNGTPYDLRVGNQVEFDLRRLLAAGETIKVGGKIPSGLKFDSVNLLLTGTITGKPGTYQTIIQILQGKTVIRTITIPITVMEFPPSLIGNFDFLMEDMSSVPIGVCKITITGDNKWSATLESAGIPKARSAKGTFILAEGAPVAPITATFPVIKATSTVAEIPALTVNISIDGSTPAITGTYNGGTLRGFRIAKVGEMPPATVAYNLVLDAGEQDGINAPAGFGWMKGKVSNKGIGAFKGLLGDGTAASITLRLSAFGQSVLWSQPYKNKSSYIGGIVTLGNLGQTTPGAAPLEDEVWWTKAADTKTLSYPDGFPGMSVTLGTSRWTAPASAAALGGSLGWSDNNKSSVVIHGAGLSNHEPQSTTAKLPTQFTLDDKFNLLASQPVGASPVAWKGKISKTDGAITGSLTFPVGFSGEIRSGSAAVSGVLVQGDSWGTTTGWGQIKVPTTVPKGSFRTAAIVLDQ